ncbi:hypothetical protein CRUP_017573, partial [Coryphaenoides rupestris]
ARRSGLDWNPEPGSPEPGARIQEPGTRSQEPGFSERSSAATVQAPTCGGSNTAKRGPRRPPTPPPGPGSWSWSLRGGSDPGPSDQGQDSGGSGPSAMPPVLCYMEEEEEEEQGCEDCSQYHDSECPELGPLVTVEDSFVLSRASKRFCCWNRKLCLETALVFAAQQSGDPRGVAGDRGVFVRWQLVKRTRFGPFEAKRVAYLEREGPFPLKIFQRDGAVVCLDSSSEDDCNWMMLVRPAADHAHQNLSAYQQDDEVYFNTSQDVLPGAELRVWYGAFYAKKLDKAMLRPPTLPTPPADGMSSAKAETLMETVSPAMQGGDDNMNAGHLLSLLPDGKLEEQQHLLPREDALLALSSTVEEALTSTSTSTTSTSTSSTSTATSTFVTRVRPAPKRAGGRGRRGRGRRGGAAASNSASSSTSADNSANRYRDKLYKCDECDKLFSRKESLKQHISYKHSKNMPDPEYKFICNMCDKSFRLENALKFHNCDKSFQCDICSRFFSTNSNLSKHKKKHGEKLFSCQVCSKMFYRKDVMQEHHRRHGMAPKHLKREELEVSGEEGAKYRKEPSPCPICGKDIALMDEQERQGFIKKIGISVDDSDDSDEDDDDDDDEEEDDPGHHKYNCKKCQLSFAKGREYLKHIMEQHKERGYGCAICHRRFALKATYNAHLVIHREQLPDPAVQKYIHPCEICGRIFNSIGNLERHKIIHTGERSNPNPNDSIH